MRNMSNHREVRSRCARRGVATVELVLILPVLMTMILGAIDFGRFAYSYIAVTNAARAAAGYASMNPYTPTTQPLFEAQLRQAALDELSAVDASSPFDPAKVTVASTRSFDPGNVLWRVRVDVTYPFETVVPWPGIPDQIDLQRSVEMRGIR